MRRGAWHQLGWQHQKMVVEQLKNNAGVGVILSPRDLSFSKAQEYVPQYKAEGASVVCDPQSTDKAGSRVCCAITVR